MEKIKLFPTLILGACTLQLQNEIQDTPVITSAAVSAKEDDVHLPLRTVWVMMIRLITVPHAQSQVIVLHDRQVCASTKPEDVRHND